MKKTKILIMLAVVLVAVTSLSISGCIPTAKYEMTVELSEPFESGGQFATKTHNGEIKVAGGETEKCDITAKITARANTEEDAKKLAEQVKIKFERSGDKLTAKIEKPNIIDNKYIGVSFDITLPKQTRLDLVTHNGAVNINQIEGDIEAHTHNGAVHADGIKGSVVLTTHNGEIKCDGVLGDVKLQTHNGPISCNGVTGNVELTTHNGSAEVVYFADAAPAVNASLTTHNGGLELKAPNELSAKIEAHTHNGSVHTDIPITVVGKVSKKNLVGTIGSGEGKLYLKTHNGSINIK